MATVQTPKAEVQDVITELSLNQQEFDYVSGEGQDQDALTGRVIRAVRRASVLTQRRVGTGNYASEDEFIHEALKEAEHALACSIMLRQRGVILSSRPEEAPPPEFIDLAALAEEVDRYEKDWDTIAASYETEDMDRAGTAFAFGAKGVDETEPDIGEGDYADLDFGALPSD